MKFTSESLRYLAQKTVLERNSKEIQEIEDAMQIAASTGRFNIEVGSISEGVKQHLRMNGFDLNYQHVGHNEYAWTISWE